MTRSADIIRALSRRRARQLVREVVPAKETNHASVAHCLEHVLEPSVGTPSWSSSFTRRAALRLGLGTAVAVGASISAVGCDGGDRGEKDAVSPRPWRHTIDSRSMSSPIVAGGVVYILSIRENTEVLDALDAVTGTEKWAYTTTTSAFLDPSSPMVADGAVYFGSHAGALYALNAATGTKNWIFDTSDWSFPLSGGWPFYSPAVVDGTVYFSAENGVLRAMNAVTGTEKWAADMRGTTFDYRPDVVDGVVYVNWDEVFHAFDAATGTEKWAVTAASTDHDDHDFISSSPAVVGGTVYFGTAGGILHALDAATGTKKWAFTTGDFVRSSPAVADGVVYFGSRDKNVYALDAATGAKKWAFTAGDSVHSSPVVVGGSVYVGSDDGKVHALDTATGTERWAFTTGGGRIESSLEVAHGLLYFGCTDGHVYAVDAATGAGPTPPAPRSTSSGSTGRR
ncbi:PQQ-binding-like beta-propeller repeat protein [Streptomyces sp. NP-1717]|uniref:outer membrane protein assembly factor BamB family protein n=1 Tax=Streptomyces sp. NP-1717 TaxID=2704470 RepID=UPI0024140EF8|nr:PQQ-binding-like beta-propeller repeat protein [Streptomyces sp. NP-1717]